MDSLDSWPYICKNLFAPIVVFTQSSVIKIDPVLTRKLFDAGAYLSQNRAGFLPSNLSCMWNLSHRTTFKTPKGK
jgi:hypothetical protein